MGKLGTSHLPYESSFIPEILTEEQRIKFACHPAVLGDEVMRDDMLKAQEETARQKDQE